MWVRLGARERVGARACARVRTRSRDRGRRKREKAREKVFVRWYVSLNRQGEGDRSAMDDKVGWVVGGGERRGAKLKVKEGVAVRTHDVKKAEVCGGQRERASERKLG